MLPDGVPPRSLDMAGRYFNAPVRLQIENSTPPSKSDDEIMTCHDLRTDPNGIRRPG